MSTPRGLFVLVLDSESMTEAAEIGDNALEHLPDEQAMAIEDGIWWAVGRRAILEQFLRRAARVGLRTIAEVGCGSGGDLGLLRRYGRVVAFERSPALARRARLRGVADEVYTDDLFDRQLPDVDLYCMFDVLEHIEDDRGFLKRLIAHGAPGHRLLLTVPACQFLYGPHDELLHHYRRYSMAHLKDVLRAAGYQPVAENHFVFLLFPAAVAARFADKLKARLGFRPKRVSLGLVPKPINAALTGVLRLEALLAQRLRLPFGLWLAVLSESQSAGAVSA